MTSRTKIRSLATFITGLTVAAGLVAITATNASATVPTPPAPACTTTVVPGLPFMASRWGTPEYSPWNELTATDNHGLWAGVRYDGDNRFQVVAWRAGVTRVLDTLTYTNFGPQGTVQVVGITSARAVIVNAWSDNGDSGRSTIYRYQSGHRYEFARNASWLAPVATAVSPDGHVTGTVRTTGNKYLIAEWDAAGRATTITDGDASDPTIDKYDDVIWDEGLPNRLRFRTPSGRLGELKPFSDPDFGSLIAAGRWAWSEPGELEHPAVQIWDMAAAVKGNLAPPVTYRIQSPFVKPVVGSASGALVASDIGRRSYALYDAYGDGHRLNTSGTFLAPYFGLATDGTLAFIGSDGRVRFVNCPLNYAKHNPRGLIYHGAVSGGQTTITGGAFDSDAVASHVSVDIYDETTSVRRRLTRIVADQYDPSFSSAYGISGNHRYRYVFPSVPGKHVYCAYGMNIGYGNTNTKLGCTTVTT